MFIHIFTLNVVVCKCKILLFYIQEEMFSRSKLSAYTNAFHIYSLKYFLFKSQWFLHFFCSLPFILQTLINTNPIKINKYTKTNVKCEREQHDSYHETSCVCWLKVSVSVWVKTYYWHIGSVFRGSSWSSLLLNPNSTGRKKTLNATGSGGGLMGTKLIQNSIPKSNRVNRSVYREGKCIYRSQKRSSALFLLY